MDNKKLKVARNKIDKIDQSIFKLIVKRTNVVKYMLTLKRHKKEIVDRNRMNIILKKIKKKSIKNNIDTKITKKIWTSMISSYIDFQKRNFKIK